jgi:histidine triad (HIT) family protein
VQFPTREIVLTPHKKLSLTFPRKRVIIYVIKIPNPNQERNIKMDCIFCKIIAGEIPCTKVYEDDKILAFRDIAPMAPVHVLVIPKKHIGSADEINAQNSDYVTRVFEKIPEIAKTAGAENGYRVITNCGEDGCQSVKHLHFHILGGVKLPEKMA